MAVPPCLNSKRQRGSRAETVRKILQLAAENADLPHAAFRDLVSRACGISPSTTYGYLRAAKRQLLEQGVPATDGTEPASAKLDGAGGPGSLAATHFGQ